MDFKAISAQAVAIAKAVSAFVPAASAVPGVIELGEKVIGIIDHLHGKTPDVRTQQEMQEARKTLAAAVKAKAGRTADRFDG